MTPLEGSRALGGISLILINNCSNAEAYRMRSPSMAENDPVGSCDGQR